MLLENIRIHYLSFAVTRHHSPLLEVVQLQRYSRLASLDIIRGHRH